MLSVSCMVRHSSDESTPSLVCVCARVRACVFVLHEHGDRLTASRAIRRVANAFFRLMYQPRWHLSGGGGRGADVTPLTHLRGDRTQSSVLRNDLPTVTNSKWRPDEISLLKMTRGNESGAGWPPANKLTATSISKHTNALNKKIYLQSYIKMMWSIATAMRWISLYFGGKNTIQGQALCLAANQELR